jgi:hypothetical protein
MRITKWSKLIRERDNYTCRNCGTKERPGETHHAHHILPRMLGGENTPDNGITLCNTCHHKAHSGDMSPQAIWRKVNSPIKVRDAAYVFGVSDVTIRDWIHRGKIPARITMEVIESRIAHIEQTGERTKTPPARMRKYLEHLKRWLG